MSVTFGGGGGGSSGIIKCSSREFEAPLAHSSLAAFVESDFATGPVSPLGTAVFAASVSKKSTPRLYLALVLPNGVEISALHGRCTSASTMAAEKTFRPADGRGF